MKKLLTYIAKHKLLIAMIVIAFAAGAVLQFAEEPWAWFSIYNEE
ncbi:hypothetical protein AB7W40_23130 [Providencia rettgeri]